MSRIYVKPESEIVELEAEVLMSVTSGELDNVGTGNGNADDNDPYLSHRRRGEWSGLWK